MGCSASKLDEEEVVKLCRDRKNFIKQAIEQRYRFALSHIAYMDSLRRVPLSLLKFVEGNEHHDFFADHYATPPFTPVKRLSPDIVGIPVKSERNTTYVINYLRSGGNSSVPVEEWLRAPETGRVESFYPSSNYGDDDFFTYEASQMSRPFASSPYNRPSYSNSFSQNSHSDFFWNPFSSLDQYGYQYRYNDVDGDETARLRKVREEEGIPDLEEDKGNEKEAEEEEEEEEEDSDDDDDDDHDHDNNSEENKEDKNSKSATKPTSVSFSDEREKIEDLKECQTQGAESMEVSEARDAVEVEAGARNGGAEETPGFTVYVNRRPNSMVDVIKELENQFVRIFDSAKEVSVMLEANSAQYSAPTELTGARILNPASLFSAPSSRSSSARFLQSSINTREDQGDETSGNYSEECCMVSGSHQATLDRLYAWEKKLYEEVKCGERIRIAYDKKCMQLRNHDVNGEEPGVVDKTRAAIRDLHTRLKVSIHSVESVSRRIEALRDEELYPQLLELIRGLARMWKAMSDCHKIQKRTIDEAKLLLFSYAANTNLPKPSESSRFKPSRHAAALISDLRNWRSTLSSYITAQRSYVHALSDWISRCATSQISAEEDQTSQSPFRIGGARAMPLFRLCFHWSRVVDSVSEGEVVEGLERLAAGIGAVSVQQKEGVVAMAEGEEGTVVAAERLAEVGERVLCAGMSAVVGALTEFAGGSAAGYEALVKKFEEGGRAGRVTSEEAGPAGG